MPKADVHKPGTFKIRSNAIGTAWFYVITCSVVSTRYSLLAKVVVKFLFESTLPYISGVAYDMTNGV